MISPATSARRRRCERLLFTLLLAVLFPLGIARAQTKPARAGDAPAAPATGRGNFAGQTDRPLRYFPDGTDFVITNGAEFFNRPLYGVNSAFRIDGGDRPEFSLYLPGRGGNLRFGLKTSAGAKWLQDARQIVARYRPGSLRYAIRDPLLGEGELNLVILPLADDKGLIARAELTGTSSPIELCFAFGGVNGMKGRRGGDIGCESEPVAQFFQLRPEQCRQQSITLTTNQFTVGGERNSILGAVSDGFQLWAGAATNWNRLENLLQPAGESNPLRLVAGKIRLTNEQPVFLALRPLDNSAPSERRDDLAKLFQNAEEHRRALAGRVVVETPDAFINAAAAALNVAADAIWDEAQQSFMHGAVAWRTRLLGWRGPYAGDALGWHERTAQHFAGFARQQNTTAIPEKIPPADEASNLARSEAAIHSNGDLSKNHYDMNLVAVDAFFRHLLWTGDTNYAAAMWPVIERHFAWERRLFRREFGAEPLPLYEAYAAIWASDDLNYNGGGTAHASAYNYFANRMAARVAKILGKDAAPYECEADLVLRGMNQLLWVDADGNFAECKDLLGRQLVHQNAGLWTFYHTLDSEVPTPAQAGQMARWVDRNLPHLPIRGANMPDEHLFTLPTTTWMPYQWSLNNVVMAEAAHTALGFWQAGRSETAFQLFKGELLDSMFLGLCPGNLGCMTSHDMARGESQRDFADAIGANSRALIEGLFGIHPDALAGELKIIPGFPAYWHHAALRHPDLNVSFQRAGLQERFVIEQKFAKPLALNLRIAPLRREVASVTVNGQTPKSAWVETGGQRRLEIGAPAVVRTEVVVIWKGSALTTDPTTDWWTASQTGGEKTAPAFDWHQPMTAAEKLETLNLTPFFNDSVTQIFRNEYRTPRSPFASLATPKQGIGGWCEPNASFEVDDSGLRQTAARHGGKFVLPNGISFATPAEAAVKNIIFTSQWDNYPREATLPLVGKSSHVFLLMAGSTSALQSRFDNGEVIVTYADGTTARLALNNPVNWWPIDQDFFTDDFAFRRAAPVPPRVDLRTGLIRLPDAVSSKGRGGKIPGGAATVLELPLDPAKELKSLTVRALANEVVIGLMGVTLTR